MSLTAIFVSAHPDDLEIGAAAAICRLVESRWEAWFVIMTDEADRRVADIRRKEAITAAGVLGVPEDHVLFMGVPDGRVECNQDVVQHLRDLVSTRIFEPDIVFTHSASDSHNDHRKCNEIVRSAIRGVPILAFAVVNSFDSSRFTPRIYVNAEPFLAIKSMALAAHTSQAKRISVDNTLQFCTKFRDQSGLNYAEAFEVHEPIGSERKLSLAMSFNDSRFSKFWLPLLGERTLNVIYSIPVYRPNRQYQWSSDIARSGIDQLYAAFNNYWYSRERRLPIEAHRSDAAHAEELIQSSDVLVSGSAVSNAIYDRYLNRDRQFRYVIDYSEKDYSDICIVDRERNIRLLAEYYKDTDGNISPIKDRAILTVMRNPFQPGAHIIGAAGVHGTGTLACHKLLCEPSYLSKLMEIISVPLQGKGFQVLLEYHVPEDFISIDSNSLHMLSGG